MNLLALLVSVILEQRLYVLPTRKRTHFPNIHLDDIDQTVTRGITKDSPLLVRGLEFPPTHSDVASCVNGALSNVE